MVPGVAGVVAVEPVAAPRVEGAAGDRGARVAHQRTRKCTLCSESRRRPSSLVGREEVAEVGAREARAGGAVAVLVERPAVGAERRVADVEPAVAREGGAVAPHARGRHAVEQVDAAARPLDEVLGEADAHEVARPVARQRRRPRPRASRTSRASARPPRARRSRSPRQSSSAAIRRAASRRRSAWMPPCTIGKSACGVQPVARERRVGERGAARARASAAIARSRRARRRAAPARESRGRTA